MSNKNELAEVISSNTKQSLPNEVKTTSTEVSVEIDTPSKKRHVIKAKHIKTSKLDSDVKNSPLSKSIGLIEKFRKQSRNRKQLNLKESSEPISDNVEKNSPESRQHNVEKDDGSPKKISRQSHTIKVNSDSQSPMKNENQIPVSSQKLSSPSFTDSEVKTPAKKLSKKKTKNRAAKSSVESHVLTEYYHPLRRSSRKTKSLIQKEQDDFIIESIKSKCEDGLEVVEFKAKGRGVIAKKSFKKGSFIVEYAGDLIDWNEAKQREKEYANDPSIGCYMYYFVFDNTNYCVDATVESGRLGRLLNHSRKNPNCKTKLVPMSESVGEGTIPRLIIVARRDIKAGEELTYDYGDRDKETLQSHPWLKST